MVLGEDQNVFLPNEKILVSLKLDKILKGHTAFVRKSIVFKDGKVLASCSDDASIKFWDFSSGKCI